jgi:beta-galactosidase
MNTRVRNVFVIPPPLRFALVKKDMALEKLNAACTAFWSQTYGDWDEIHPPRKAPTFINPVQQLDWKRFISDSWIACFERQKGILNTSTPNVPVTTNFMSFFKPIDYWKLSAREDVVHSITILICSILNG